MIQYELTYKHPDSTWDHDGNDFWREEVSTHLFKAHNKKDALKKAGIFLRKHNDWGDYSSPHYKGTMTVPTHIKLVNKAIKLTRLVEVWK